MLQCVDVIRQLEAIAPLYLAEAWDNSGWQIGNPDSTVKGILVCLEVSTEVLAEANRLNCNLIISHHPLIFTKLSSVNARQPNGKLLLTSAKADINIYSAHTNLDVAWGGISDYLAELLQLKNIGLLQQTKSREYYKLCVFTPVDYADAVRNAICTAGAGSFKNYTDCTFSALGEGAFRPGLMASPHIGKIGDVTKVQEEKIESILPADKLTDVLAALRRAHPYEEIAFDVLPLVNEFQPMGIGRIGERELVRIGDIVDELAGALDLQSLTLYGKREQKVKKIAVCGGSGGDFIPSAINQRVDLYICGDIKYHQAREAATAGMSVIDIGHFESEVAYMPKLATHLRESLSDNDIPVYVAEEKQLDKHIFTFPRM